MALFALPPGALDAIALGDVLTRRYDPIAPAGVSIHLEPAAKRGTRVFQTFRLTNFGDAIERLVLP